MPTLNIPSKEYIDNNFLSLQGGTLNGVLKMPANMYTDARNGALDMSNSDIFNANSIYFSDLCDNGAEGFHFWRSDTTVDTLWAKNGSLYFTPNRTMGSTNTNYILLHSGNSVSYGSGWLTRASNNAFTLDTDVCNVADKGWGKYQTSLHWFSQTGLITDQPQQYGYILNIGQLSECHQLWFGQPAGRIYHRGGNGSGWGASWKQLWQEGDTITGAVWNDYAECRESSTTKPGLVLKEKGDDTLIPTEERLSHFCGVSSDTYGFSQGETDKAKTPIAVAGRVLVYTFEPRDTFEPGDCVCAGPGGTVSKMTRQEIIEWPDRIVGKVSCVPDYEIWGGGEGADREPVKVDGRIWIQVK